MGAGNVAAGILGGATTMLARSATRRVMHRRRTGARRLPRNDNGIGVMLAWAAAAGVLLALADVVSEQRKATTAGMTRIPRGLRG